MKKNIVYVTVSVAILVFSIFLIEYNKPYVTFDFTTCEITTSREDYSIVNVTFHYDKTRHHYDYLIPEKTINSLNLCNPNLLFLYKKDCNMCMDSLWESVPTRFLKNVDCLIFITVGKLKKVKHTMRFTNEDTMILEIDKEDWGTLKTKKAIPYRI